jgi:ankyrin repeat protein
MVGQTALMWAAQQNRPLLLKALITAGADVNARDRHGDTALQIAAHAHLDEIVTLLKQSGARE